MLSKRVIRTSTPVVVSMHKAIAQSPRDVISLAQGQTYWNPPESCLERVSKTLTDPSSHRYGAGSGKSELVEKLVSEKFSTLKSVNLMASFEFDLRFNAHSYPTGDPRCKSSCV